MALPKCYYRPSSSSATLCSWPNLASDSNTKLWCKAFSSFFAEKDHDLLVPKTLHLITLWIASHSEDLTRSYGYELIPVKLGMQHS